MQGGFWGFRSFPQGSVSSRPTWRSRFTLASRQGNEYVSGLEDDRAQGLHLTKIKVEQQNERAGVLSAQQNFIARENHRVRMRDRAVAATYGSLKLSAIECFPMCALATNMALAI